MKAKKQNIWDHVCLFFYCLSASALSPQIRRGPQNSKYLYFILHGTMFSIAFNFVIFKCSWNWRKVVYVFSCPDNIFLAWTWLHLIHGLIREDDTQLVYKHIRKLMLALIKEDVTYGSYINTLKTWIRRAKVGTYVQCYFWFHF